MRRRDILAGAGLVAGTGLGFPAPAIAQGIRKLVMVTDWPEAPGMLPSAREHGPQASQALGYKQILEHLEGRCSLQEAVEQIKIRTRRYAKQQRTWLRQFRIHGGSVWLDASESALQGPKTHLQQALDALSADRG